MKKKYIFYRLVRFIFKPVYVSNGLAEANEELYITIASLLRNNMSRAENEMKKFTEFKEWEVINEQKKSS